MKNDLAGPTLDDFIREADADNKLILNLIREKQIADLKHRLIQSGRMLEIEQLMKEKVNKSVEQLIKEGKQERDE